MELPDQSDKREVQSASHLREIETPHLLAELSEDLMSGVTRDPVSGRPFEFNAESRIVSLHQEIEALSFDPIALPW